MLFWEGSPSLILVQDILFFPTYYIPMTLSTRGLAVAASLALAPMASAQLFTYNQDFESVDMMSPSALSADGWIVFGYVVNNNVFQYGYGPFPAPNPGAGFSSVGSGNGGAMQGSQYMDIYNDYANGDHNIGSRIEASVFIEEIVAPGDVGETFTFSFDYLNNPTNTNNGATTTQAFIKVFKSSDGSFDPLGLFEVDTTNASSSAWTSDSISVVIDPAWLGESVQFGFSSTASNFEDSSRLYDNISFSSPTSQTPGLRPYAQDFEALDIMSPSGLSDDSWGVFANVFDSGGGYAYGYGTNPAPNGGPAFSAIDTGNQGANQGTQYISAYSDYNNQDHGAGFLINALLFQEQEVGSVDVGKVYSFSFDYLKSPVVTNGDGQTTTAAFLKVLRSSDNTFAEIVIDSLDTTNASTTTWASTTLQITIDASMVGETLQFGFESSATAFADSGRFYDNLVFGEAVSIGTNYCSAPANSSGLEASMSASGSNVAADNNVTLSASQMAINQFGIFVVSASQTFVPGLGGASNGNLCLGGAIGRYNRPGQILGTGATGSFDLQINLATVPQGSGFVSTSAGQTWNFQAWFRDSVGLGSNLTDGYEIVFQ